MTDAGQQTTDLAGQADDGAGEVDEEQEQEGQAELLWHVTQAKQAPASPNQGRRASGLLLIMGHGTIGGGVETHHEGARGDADAALQLGAAHTHVARRKLEPGHATDTSDDQVPSARQRLEKGVSVSGVNIQHGEGHDAGGELGEDAHDGAREGDGAVHEHGHRHRRVHLRALRDDVALQTPRKTGRGTYHLRTQLRLLQAQRSGGSIQPGPLPA